MDRFRRPIKRLHHQITGAGDGSRLGSGSHVRTGRVAAVSGRGSAVSAPIQAAFQGQECLRREGLETKFFEQCCERFVL